MDSAYPPNQSFAPQPKYSSLDRVILCESKEGAETFLREVFPHFSHCLVVSADRHYPRNEELNELVFRALSDRANLRVVVLGGGALRKICLKTDRWWVLDELIMQDFKRHPSDRAISLGLTPEKLAFLIETFFGQWEKVERTANPGFAYQNYAEYNHGKFDWRVSLLGLPANH